MINEPWGVEIKKALYATVPHDQIPVPGTCDEKAQLIVANMKYADFPEVVDLSFSHLSSYGKISTLALPEGATEIVGVTLESNKAMSGEIYYYFDQPGNVHVNNKNATNCGALNRNMLAVSVASLLYEGKTKAQIFDVVNFLHLLIALSKSY